MTSQNFSQGFNVVNLMGAERPRILVSGGYDPEDGPEVGVIQAYAPDADKPGTTLVFVSYNAAAHECRRLDVSFNDFHAVLNKDGVFDADDVSWEKLKITRNRALDQIASQVRSATASLAMHYHEPSAALN